MECNRNLLKKPYLVGKWLPSDQLTLFNWMEKIMKKADEHEGKLLPSVQALKDFIENDPKAYMFFTQMFEQVDDDITQSPNGLPQVRDYHHMLKLFNVIMTHAPDFDETAFVGFPFNAIFNFSMTSAAGSAAFLDKEVNLYLKAILDEWGIFLKSPESVSVLNEHPKKGWFGEDAKKAMPTFVEDFNCDPSKPYYGFCSWDDFFTRTFREGKRPVSAPDDNKVIVQACESAPYNIAYNVQLRDKFWVKAQPYALQFMLDNDPRTHQFVGGTIYQAFLSALSYHRWHAPVSGKVVRTKVVSGGDYTQAVSMGYQEQGQNASQGYITEVATRALIFIEADEPSIGLMCFVAVGMAEVSTCEIKVYEGQHITKGQEIGMFHFGGSTHCLVFRPEVKLEFDLHGQKLGLGSGNIPVNSRIAV